MEQVEVKPASIDKDVLDIMAQEDILTAISDDKQCKRLILNCFCEFLSQIKSLKEKVDGLQEIITVCSADKISKFFKKVRDNTKKEVQRENLQNKMKQSHLKAKKAKKE